MPDELAPILADLLLSIADDKLLLGHRNSDWTGLGPILEEDIAFSALAQDDMAHAQALYEEVAHLVGGDADAIAFGRAPEAYRCAAIVEIPDEFDWAAAIARQFYCDAFDAIRLERLAASSAKRVADLCRRLHAEQEAHERHSRTWIGRLAGEPAARHRVQTALDALAPHAAMLTESVADEPLLVAAGLYPSAPSDLFELWETRLRTAAEPAGYALSLPRPNPSVHGGRRGVRTPHFAALHAEMTEVWRLEPGAAW